jgi:hypothetical protein
MQLEKAKIFRRGRIRRAAKKGCERPDVPYIIVALRIVMSSIMRWRNGLIASSVMGMLLS